MLNLPGVGPASWKKAVRRRNEIAGVGLTEEQNLAPFGIATAGHGSVTAVLQPAAKERVLLSERFAVVGWPTHFILDAMANVLQQPLASPPCYERVVQHSSANGGTWRQTHHDLAILLNHLPDGGLPHAEEDILA
ncbi:hypothetical protein HaLaN_15850, partial [Haematococcus lacustris]